MRQPQAIERTRDWIRERYCRVCRDWWPIEDFARNPHCTDGRTNTCRACIHDRRTASALLRVVYREL